MRRILLLALPTLLACGRKAPPPPKAPTPTPAVDPTRIPALGGWVSLGPPRPSAAGPHRGSLQRIYLNPEAARALEQARFNPWPDGAQLVKEALDRKGRRLGWFWMSKERSQWVWAAAGPEGRVEARQAGEASGACAACHAVRASAFDGAFTPGLPRSPRPAP